MVIVYDKKSILEGVNLFSFFSLGQTLVTITYWLLKKARSLSYSGRITHYVTDCHTIDSAFPWHFSPLTETDLFHNKSLSLFQYGSYLPSKISRVRMTLMLTRVALV